MKGILHWAQGVAIAWGGPGLFFVAFLDSSFLSLPEINDFLVVWMVTQHKERVLYYAGLSTAGSIAGCFVLYAIAWKGGEAVLRRWFAQGAIDKATAQVRRFGLLALLVPAILPPPAPFKLFVLLAGVARVSPLNFALAIGLGRGFRYLAEGMLAVWYGDIALQYIDDHGREVALWAGIGVFVIGVLYFLWRRRDRQLA